MEVQLLTPGLEHGSLHVQGYDLIFYGDSITEIWRGTSCGSPFKVTNGDIDNTTYVSYDLRAVTYEAFAHKYRTGVMGIAGAHMTLTHSQHCQPHQAVTGDPCQ